MFEDQLSKIPGAPPRKIELLSGLRFWNGPHKADLIAAIAILFGAALMIGLFTWLQFTLNLSNSFINEELNTTSGEVLTVNLYDMKNDDREYKTLGYRFVSIGELEYRDEFNVSEKSQYFGVIEGDSVPIVYVADDPTVNGIDGEIDKDNEFRPFLPMLLIILIFVGLFFSVFLNLRQYKEHRKVFKSGKIVPGRILFVKSPNAARRLFYSVGFEIFYEYELLTGESIESKVRTVNEWFANVLRPGDKISVAYLPNKPKKSMILECYVR